MSEQILVEITNGRGWYSDKLGEQYYVYQHSNYPDHWALFNDDDFDTHYLIVKLDCKIITETIPKIFVKITNIVDADGAWYKKHIGEIFSVEEIDNDIFPITTHYHVIGSDRYIMRKNCVVVNAESTRSLSVYLKPRVEHIKQRMYDITKAIDANLDNSSLSPDEWYSELQELSQTLKGLQ